MSDNQSQKIIDVLESIDEKLGILIGTTNLIFEEVSTVSSNVSMNDSELSSIRSNTSDIRDILNVVEQINMNIE